MHRTYSEEKQREAKRISWTAFCPRGAGPLFSGLLMVLPTQLNFKTSFYCFQLCFPDEQIQTQPYESHTVRQQPETSKLPLC